MKKLIWAIDPFEPQSETQQNTHPVVEIFSDRLGLVIEPVYVLSPDALDIPKTLSPGIVKFYQAGGEKLMSDILHQFKMKSSLKPKVLIQEHPSLSQSVFKLTDYARNTHAQLIVVGTHARKGIQRFLLGSFCESVVLASPVSVLTVNPHCKTELPKTIIFPTGLGEKAREYFEYVVSIAQSLHASVHLFHVAPDPVEEMAMASTGIIIPSFAEMIDQAEQEMKIQAQEWAEYGKQKGVSTEVSFHKKTKRIPEMIVDYADQHSPSWIAIGAQSGPFQSAILGSISRQVIRQANCPVLAMRGTTLSLSKLDTESF